MIGLVDWGQAEPRRADRRRAFAEDDILTFRELANQGRHPVGGAEAPVAIHFLGANGDRDTGVMMVWMIAGPERVRRPGTKEATRIAGRVLHLTPPMSRAG